MLGVAADVSAAAREPEARLRAACDQDRIALPVFRGGTIVDPGALRPSGGGDAYRVFTPYYRAWTGAKWRDEVATPRRITLPEIAVGRLPAMPDGESPNAATGGETEGRRKLTVWLRDIEAYAEKHDDLPGDGTSRLSPYLRFGCLSPLALADAALTRKAEPFLRQLCWRDFYYQVALAFPRLSTAPYRPAANDEWRDDP